MNAGEADAKIARTAFSVRKEKALRKVGGEQLAPSDALSALEKLYAKQTAEFLRKRGTTYRAWLEHGPRGEIEELREARRDDALWDRLVDRAMESAGAP